uniref:Endonuclease-reverse transcriptase n=1 Tax=Arion vulgaris TaxID=1028688 RepID=A0A0B7BS73_9EUPU
MSILISCTGIHHKLYLISHEIPWHWMQMYNSCVLSTLLYGSECWRMTEQDMSRLSTFHTTCLRKILRVYWPTTISNQELLARCQQENMGTIIRRRRWRWIGHVMRMETGSDTKTALRWTPEGRRKRGRPKTTWRRTIEQELKEMNHSWNTIQRKAMNREEWCTFVAALNAKGVTG